MRGVVPGEAVTTVACRWAGSRSVVLTFRTSSGRVDEQIVYRTQEAELSLDGGGTAWSFSADGALFRLVAEAQRIRLAYLFDPLLAVHTPWSNPCLTRSPPSTKRCCPASRSASAGRRSRRRQDDHGRAAHQGADRSAATCSAASSSAPGSLVEQWQDELTEKFGLALRDPDERQDRGGAHRQLVR